MKDETIVSCVVVGGLVAIAVTCAATGYNHGLMNTIITAIASVGGIILGRATRSS